MEKRIASIISYISHPLLMPMIGLLVISNSGTYAADLDNRFTHFIYLSTFLLTFMIPARLCPYYIIPVWRGTYNFQRGGNGCFLYTRTLFFYIAAYFLIRKLPVSQVYQRFMFAACLSVLLVLAISYFWKISAHLVGWGGVVGLIVILSYQFGSDMMIFLVVAILFTGITAFARLRLNEHIPLQVYSGFLLGLLTVLIVFSI